MISWIRFKNVGRTCAVTSNTVASNWIRNVTHPRVTSNTVASNWIGSVIDPRFGVTFPAAVATDFKVEGRRANLCLCTVLMPRKHLDAPESNKHCTVGLLGWRFQGWQYRGIQISCDSWGDQLRPRLNFYLRRLPGHKGNKEGENDQGFGCISIIID